MLSTKAVNDNGLEQSCHSTPSESLPMRDPPELQISALRTGSACVRPSVRTFYALWPVDHG